VIIDSHLHIGLNGRTAESLIRYLDRNGIEKGWVLTWDEQYPIAPMYYQSLDIKQVRQAFRMYPDRIVPFYAPDPGRTDWRVRLEDCLDEGFAGCGELKVPYRWDDERMVELLEFLDEKGLPLIFHMERPRKIFVPRKQAGADWLIKRLYNERFNGKTANMIDKVRKGIRLLDRYMESRLIDFPGYLMDMALLEEAVMKYRNITFIAHGPHTWNHFSIPRKDYLFHQEGRINGKGQLWSLLERYDNFYCDISGFSGYNALQRDRTFTREFLTTLYAKILFGTDNMELGLKKLLDTSGLATNQLDAIFYSNAAGILRSQQMISSRS